jgi:hypothetical protein
MAAHLLIVKSGVNFTHPSSAGQPTKAVVSQNARHASVGDCDVVISHQVPNDDISLANGGPSQRPQVGYG